MLIDSKKCMKAILAGQKALMEAHLQSRANTKNRMVDSIRYGTEKIHQEDDLVGFLKGWVEMSNGSSAWMLVNFMSYVLTCEPPNEFTEATKLVEKKLYERYSEPPKQFGMMLAFNVLAAMAQDSTLHCNVNREELFRKAAPVITAIAQHNKDIGFRCFAVFLKGFAEAL